MARRVVITGCSAITPIGRTRAEILRHLTEGVSGVKPLRKDGFLSDYIHSGVYGTVDYPIDVRFQAQPQQDDGPGRLLRLPGGQGGAGGLGARPGDHHLGPAGGRVRLHARQPLGPAQHLQDLLHRGRDRPPADIGRGRGLPQVHGAHDGGQHHQDVRDHRARHLVVHCLHHQQPVDRVRLRNGQVRPAGRHALRRGRRVRHDDRGGVRQPAGLLDRVQRHPAPDAAALRRAPRRAGGRRGSRGGRAGGLRARPPAGRRHSGRGHRVLLQQQRRRPDPAEHRRDHAHADAWRWKRPRSTRPRSISSAPTPRPPRWGT